MVTCRIAPGKRMSSRFIYSLRIGTSLHINKRAALCYCIDLDLHIYRFMVLFLKNRQLRPSFWIATTKETTSRLIAESIQARLISINMPTHKGIKLSVVSQWELQIHPEFRHPDSSQFSIRSPDLTKVSTFIDYSPPSASSDSKADRILGRQSTVSVYIPSLSGAAAPYATR